MTTCCAIFVHRTRTPHPHTHTAHPHLNLHPHTRTRTRTCVRGRLTLSRLTPEGAPRKYSARRATPGSSTASRAPERHHLTARPERPSVLRSGSAPSGAPPCLRSDGSHTLQSSARMALHKAGGVSRGQFRDCIGIGGARAREQKETLQERPTCTINTGFSLSLSFSRYNT